MADQKQAILNLKVPGKRWQLRGFLGMAYFCHIWILNFGCIAKPLYEALKGSDVESLIWITECQNVFKTLNKN